MACEFIDRVSRLTDINFKYKKYLSKKALQKSIDKGQINVYFDYYNYSNDNYLAKAIKFH